jgi:GR25 family glycosyltransferase involved in LPS biosynthesis
MNLDSRPDRWHQAVEQFKNSKIIVNRFRAFNGKAIYRGQKPIRSGEFGCLFTHLSILLDARANNYDKILIFEDDVELHSEFNKIASEFLEEVPENWDMIYFGANTARNVSVRVSSRVNLANSLLGGHAYAVNRRAYDRLIHLLESEPYPVDETYSRNHVLMNTYLCNPIIAWQKEGWSDINNQHVNYQFLKEMR